MGKPRDLLVSLPEDIIFDVLARLPVKTLCRLRCVSKGWRALISDPTFAAAQGSRSAAAPIVAGVFKKTRPLPPGSSDPSPYELRVIDTASGDVLSVVKDVRSPDHVVPTRLDLVFIARGSLGACWVIDPATGGVLTFNRAKSGKYPRTNYDGTTETVRVGVNTLQLRSCNPVRHLQGSSS
ncbi:hypothetical protein C2845_PM07G13050 [Panicum miliaceum]|uniref:F-box domain-containing protein n=1 Tax=Panicum miliaceum TaxID=4540 RepID=A0A3L6STV6_PANMI|nr:hypothetical protein C2845_PM07G13050 [Panicum miliaceum]